MRAVVQRVTRGAVVTGGEVVGSIGAGLVVLLGVTHGDTEDDGDRLAHRLHRLRVLDGDLSLADGVGAVLVVSQFTLYADTRKGRRPSWSAAAPAEVAEPLYEAFCASLRRRGVPVETGRFGATMSVEIVGDGPVTLLLDT
ncbi:MAG: D-aminoacyl-tRNA deacylase [Aeromicrobium sp.]|uniref:D-aminoacyl-tRNA deacylase n=1 Tax=Aeromicrobium sp. TaxID=1871063 RepID=UPI002628FCFD|nr:D-aminoacyl-tRNA deacylase [Aeromicrobium sp.]MDF1704446.1 D-aminoacyl-tRNA deacylase [Aeromicrobium sp.]